MAGKKNVVKKSTKVKLNKIKKSEVAPAPRLRLEPRLIPSPSKKIKSSENEVDACEKSSFSEGRVFLTDTCKEASCAEKSYEQQRNEVFDAESSDVEQQRNEVFDAESLSVVEESRCSETETAENSNPKSNEIEKTQFKGLSKQSKIKRRINKTAFKGLDWNDREWMDLAIALQKHGFSDLKKIADCVKTKNENDIKRFFKLRRNETVYDPENKKWNRQGNAWNTQRPEFLATWPNIRKWRKLAYEQMLLYTRSKDYSKPVLSALCKKFYEEEKEPSDAQVINVKLIYKYMMSCMSGDVPPQLPPKESALVLDLLREVRLMPIAYDFEEERKFLQDFRSATIFKPFQVKDEFRKRYKKEPDNVFSPNTVAVPEEVFLDLSRHKRLTQSFSPLVTPVWMLQKEQEVLEKYAEESSVYVD